MKQNNVVTLAAMKARGEKISQLTCYDYSTARLMDQAGISMAAAWPGDAGMPLWFWTCPL